MDWENHLENPIQKIKKRVKIKVKLPDVKKKPLARKPIFVQTLFSHYFKTRAKKFYACEQIF